MYLCCEHSQSFYCCSCCCLIRIYKNRNCSEQNLTDVCDNWDTEMRQKLTVNCYAEQRYVMQCFIAIHFVLVQFCLSMSQNMELQIPQVSNNNETDFKMGQNDQSRLCAFMNVSHNSSYKIFDRELYSKGLDQIHSTSDIFEEFINIKVEPQCEATICELILLDPVARTRKCYNVQGNYDFYVDSTNVADPATKNYIVSSGCSCKNPSKGCDSTQCNQITLKDDECGRLYKEASCSECRYDATSLAVLDSFIPTNGFWCQSYVIREGCRLSIDSIDEKGTSVSNFANYTGMSSNTSLNYIRKPTPPKFSCLCDVKIDPSKPDHMNLVPVIAGPVVSLLFLIIIACVLRKCVRIKIEKKSNKQFKDLVKRFRYGFSKDEVECLEGAAQNSYVSIGHLNAIQQPYDDCKWETDRQLVLIEEPPIGIGEFGTVYSGYLLKNSNSGKDSGGIRVAVKVPKLVNNLQCFTSSLDEIKTLAYIGSHPNVVQFLGACTKDIPMKQLLIILGLCSSGNLKNYLQKNKASFLEENTNSMSESGIQYVSVSTAGYATMQSISSLPVNSRIKFDKFRQLIFWANQIVSGLEYISQKQVIHIDLAARNIFLTESLDCQIGDFGLSKRLNELVNYVRIGDEFLLPFRWMAIESLKELIFTSASDVWAFAVLLYEIFSLGNDPYPKVFGLNDLLQMLVAGKRLEKPFHCSDDIYNIMLKCWDVDCNNRPTFEQLKLLFEAM